MPRTRLERGGIGAPTDNRLPSCQPFVLSEVEAPYFLPARDKLRAKGKQRHPHHRRHCEPAQAGEAIQPGAGLPRSIAARNNGP